jgi:iron complex outermembrane receptor protein
LNPAIEARPPRRRRRRLASICIASIAASFGGVARAQVADAPPAAVVETIIVTAERRGTDVQRTPVAVTAVSAKTLDEGFVTHINGLNGLVPGLQTTKTAGFENLVTIRGVGSATPENGLVTVPGVSQFVDGVYIANTISLGQTLFDIEHIEVMRGPQGALYGQSSIAGAISIITKQPKLNDFEGAADVSFGTHSLSRVRAAVNLPVSDTVAVRAAIQKFDRDGFTRVAPLAPFRMDDAHDGSVKAAVLWKPRDDFSATLTAQLYKSDQHGDAQKNITDPLPDPRKVFQDYPGHFELESQLYHLNLKWDGPLFSLRSVSAYQGLDHEQRANGSRSAFSLLGFYDDIAAWNTHVHNYTEEFDLLSPEGARLEWILGVFALYQGSKQYVLEFGGTTQPTAADLTPRPDISWNPPTNLNYGNISHVIRRSYSAFAQASYHVSDAVRVTGGIRYNRDFFRDDSYNFNGFGVGSVVNRRKDRIPTWRLEADYEPAPGHMVYASYARGYKPGGVNGNTGQAVIQPTFEPEKNDAFEVGSKNVFLEGSLRLNLAAFYYNHRNFQYIQADPVPFHAGISNVPKIRDYGLEIEAQYVGPEDRLRAGGALSLAKGKILGSYRTIDAATAAAIINDPRAGNPCAFGGAFFNPACWTAIIAAAKDIGGKSPPAMPEVSGAAWVSYRWDLAGGAFTAKAQYVHRGAMWARIFNDPALDQVKAYDVADLYLEYDPQSGRLHLSIAATNLFDTAGVNSRFTDPYGSGQTSQQYIPPRQVIGTVAYSF